MPETDVVDVPVSVQTVRRFADLFARVRRPHILETAESWLTRKSDLTDGMIATHLHGGLTAGVRVDGKRGNGRIAANVALEVDFGDREEPPETVLPRVIGDPGLTVAEAVRAAGHDLHIPESAWCFAWSGGRSLHAWLTPREPVNLAAAYAVAQAIRDGVDARIAACGLYVCRAWPTNATGGGMGIRLPWGRHQRTGKFGRFVRVGDGLSLRDPYPADVGYLATLERNVLEPSVLIAAAEHLRRDPDPVRRERPARTRPAAPRETGDRGDRIERTLPAAARRIARPCIMHLVERGVPEDLRHDVALLLRAELVHCGLTQAEAWPVYMRYMVACTPSWEIADARRDLDANWSITDPARRHLCPGRGDPSNLTRYLHERCCVGLDACGWRRAAAALAAWDGHLSTDARSLYLDLCKMEAGFSLRPGDAMHTTTETLMERCRLGWRRFETARTDLRHVGLLAWERTGRPDGAGTPGGGVHSLYRRIIPVPVPPELAR